MRMRPEPGSNGFIGTKAREELAGNIWAQNRLSDDQSDDQSII